MERAPPEAAMGPGPAPWAQPGKSPLPNSGPAGSRTEEAQLHTGRPRLLAILHRAHGTLPHKPVTLLLCPPGGVGHTPTFPEHRPNAGWQTERFPDITAEPDSSQVSVPPIRQTGNRTLKKGKTACSR